jgi:hypothetical protein
MVQWIPVIVAVVAVIDRILDVVEGGGDRS